MQFLVIAGALPEHFFAHHGEAQNLTEEVHHLLGSGQPAQVAVNDHAVEAVVDKGQQISESLRELFHGPALDSPGRRTGGSQNIGSADRENNGGRGNASAWPMKFVTFRTRRPSMMAGWLLSVNWSYFPPIREVPGC